MNRLLVLLLMLCVVGHTQAHPLAPALLELREQAPGHYSVLWRTSVSRVRRADVVPQLPASCVEVSAPVVSTEENESLVARWAVRCAASGLEGETLGIHGIEQSGINVILRIEQRNGRVLQALLDARQPDFIVPAAQESPGVFPEYLKLGIEHLLTGLDHLLFVTGLLLLVRRLRPLVLTITAFTLGHSVTLAAATLGLFRVNPALTELGIALSILVLALQLVRPVGERSAFLVERPWRMAGLFGLLHGLGFAGVLADVGLPQGEIPLALLAFNLGIEIGQLLFVAVLLLPILLARRLSGTEWGMPVQWRAVARLSPAYLIGSLAAFWCFERVGTLLG